MPIFAIFSNQNADIRHLLDQNADIRHLLDRIGKGAVVGTGAVVEKDGRVEGLGDLVQVEEKTESNAHLKSMEKKSSQTAASKPNPKQERKRISKEAKGSQCAGKRGGDRATSNEQ